MRKTVDGVHPTAVADPSPVTRDPFGIGGGRRSSLVARRRKTGGEAHPTAVARSSVPSPLPPTAYRLRSPAFLGRRWCARHTLRDGRVQLPLWQSQGGVAPGFRDGCESPPVSHCAARGCHRSPAGTQESLGVARGLLIGKLGRVDIH